MNQIFYIVVDDVQQGPFSIEELKKENIKKDTLVWSEDMDDWKEAKNIKELEEILKKSPPPIPSKPEKSLKVEAEIVNRKEKLITPQIEVAVAKETKSVFKQIRYGFIIGILAFPFFYFAIYQVGKYDNYDVSKNVSLDSNGLGRAAGLNSSDFPNSLYSLTPSGVEFAIKERKEFYTRKSAYSSLITFLLVSGTLILVRYVSKSMKWIDETSKMEI